MFSLLAVAGAATATATALIIAYGIILKRTPPPKINPNDVPTDNGRKYIVTTDGRIVEYYVYGSSKPNAKVLLDISGGCMSAKFLVDIPGLLDVNDKLNVKVIGITLPGWGYSSLNPGRKYVDYPKTDIQPILAAENVTGKFAVSGTSLGAPHAMAVAHYYGCDRVSMLGVRVPFLDMTISNEYTLPKGQPSVPTNAVCGDGTWYSWAIHLSMYLLNKMISINWMIKYMMPSKYVHDYPVITDMAIKCLRESQEVYGYHGLLQCMVHDTIVLWGFDVREIDVKKMVIWYGKDDDDCPPSHGKWLTEYFHDRVCNVRVFDGYGHFGAAIIDYGQYVKTLMNNADW